MRNSSDYAKLSIALNREKIRIEFLGLYHSNLNLGPRIKGASRTMALTSGQGRTEQTRVMIKRKDIPEPVFSR